MFSSLNSERRNCLKVSTPSKPRKEHIIYTWSFASTRIQPKMDPRWYRKLNPLAQSSSSSLDYFSKCYTCLLSVKTRIFIEQSWTWFVKCQATRNICCYSDKADLSVPNGISAHNHDLLLLHCLTLTLTHLDVPAHLQRNHSISEPPQVECCKSQIRRRHLFNPKVHGSEFQ